MKGPQRIKKVKLPVSGYDDITIIGLVCTDPHYKLALKLNKKLGATLKSAPPVEIHETSGKDLSFTRFSDTTSLHDVSLHFLSNRSGVDFLLKKLGNIDYLLEIYDPGKTYLPEDLLAKLREIDTVTAVFKIDINVIKDKNLKFLFA
ncbi:MAG: IPExxxVDY family protein [Bacteroidales bacterium]|nr:IPExxxVDY family protein [Bacteroidales bacterium]